MTRCLDEAVAKCRQGDHTFFGDERLNATLT
jgi:hypothetical protein